MKYFTVHDVLEFLKLSHLKGSGFKMSVSLGNSLIKKGDIHQASITYWKAIKPFFLSTSGGWSENIWHGGDFLINHDYRCVYCPIGKVASTSLIRVFVQMSNLPIETAALELPRGYIHDYAKHNLTLAAHHNQAEAVKILNDQSYFKFAIVRNPWTRLISAYLDKFVVKPHIRKSLFLPRNIKQVIDSVYGAKGLNPDYRKSISFRQFVEYIKSTKDEHLDGHWKPQYLYLGNIQFDFIARFENLTEDFEYIKQKLNITKLSLPHTNKSKTNKSQGIDAVARSQESCNNKNYSDCCPFELISLKKLPSYYEFYTPDLISVVRQRYIKDIEKFGYDFEN